MAGIVNRGDIGRCLRTTAQPDSTPQSCQLQDQVEWFNPNTQSYFYGWSNQQAKAISKWAIIDIVQHKRLVAAVGDLDNMGEIQQNHRHDTANFFAIPILKLEPSFIAQSPGLI